MNGPSVTLKSGMAALVMVLGIGGVAAGNAFTSASDGPLDCEIRATSSGGMVSIEGVANARQPVTGSYSLEISSSGGGGNSNIRQGGAFSAAPGSPAVLGQVMLNAGALYDARLTIDAAGISRSCEEKVGGSL